MRLLQREAQFRYEEIIYRCDEMGGACGTHARDEKCIQGFGGKT
jgi:hypothetical protein